MEEFTKDEWTEEMKQDAYDQRREEEDALRLEYDLEDNYNFFCKHFSEEFDRAIDVITDLKALHDKYGHTLEIEDLI